MSFPKKESSQSTLRFAEAPSFRKMCIRDRFEGPEWLDYLIRKVTYDQNIFKLITPGDYLDIYKRNQVSTQMCIRDSP